MDVRVKKENQVHKGTLWAPSLWHWMTIHVHHAHTVIIKTIILICILREMFYRAIQLTGATDRPVRQLGLRLTDLRVSRLLLQGVCWGLKTRMSACRAFLPMYFLLTFITTLGLRRCSVVNVPEQQSCFCFSGPLPITSDAACPPHFCGLEVFRRAEAAASSIFFSATFWDTRARNTGLRVSSSAPQVSIVSGSTHCWPLGMLQNAASSSPAPPSSFYSPPLPLLPFPLSFLLGSCGTGGSLTLHPRLVALMASSSGNPPAPVSKVLGLQESATVLRCFLLFLENLNTVENTWSHTQR